MLTVKNRRISMPNNKSKYTLDNLREHTVTIRAQSAEVQGKQQAFINQAFVDFDDYLDRVEKQPATLVRNVRLLLACKLFNHVYLAFILAESGLIVDAVLCERNALE